MCVCMFECDSDVKMNVSSGENAAVSGVMKERETWCFCPPQAQSDRMQCHGVIAMFVSSLRVNKAGMEGTLVGSDPKAPSGIALISLPL